MVAGLVEADVAVMADAKQLDVHAAPVLDLALVGFAHGGDVGGQTIGDDGIFGLDGNVVKQVFLHEAAVALRVVGRKTLVLVEVCGANARKVELASLFAGDQLAVQWQRGRAGGKAHDAGGLGVDDSLKFVGSRLSHFFGCFDFDDIQVQHFDRSLLLISVWILFLPVPRVAAHIDEIFSAFQPSTSKLLAGSA